MADPKKKRIIDLPAATIARLKTGGEELDMAQRQVDLLKKIGMDTTALQEKLDWSKMVRKELLEEFVD